MKDYRTPLSKARGLGSAKSGVGHFVGQRVSAVALAILIPIFVWAIATLPGGDYDSARAFVGSPLGALIFVLALSAAFFHMRIGLQVVIEDYIHKPATKMVLLVANTLIAAGLWLAMIYSVLAIAA
ncbi:MAG: succinate dehydrogenase, hydrophobic membrane anchor protein [Oceanicaulis sp.]